jgi:Pentapeptide repeats (8 copies)
MASGERGREFIREVLPDWSPTRNQVVWTIRIAIALFILVIILDLVADYYNKTLWDWLDLLIAPAVVAGGIAWFSQQQERQQSELEDARAQAEALQAYLNQMGTLLLEKELRTSEANSDVRELARARTMTILDVLSPRGRVRVLEFLFDLDLIQTIPSTGKRPNITPLEKRPVISLRFANLRGIGLASRQLLKGADLDRANLRKADLTNAKLIRADLTKARLMGADVTGADLSHANLTEARLMGANLTDADLTDADLKRGQRMD